MTDQPKRTNTPRLTPAEAQRVANFLATVMYKRDDGQPDYNEGWNDDAVAAELSKSMGVNVTHNHVRNVRRQAVGVTLRTALSKLKRVTLKPQPQPQLHLTPTIAPTPAPTSAIHGLPVRLAKMERTIEQLELRIAFLETELGVK